MSKKIIMKQENTKKRQVVNNWNIDDQTKGVILFVGVFVIIIFLVTRETKEKGDGYLEKLSNELRGSK